MAFVGATKSDLLGPIAADGSFHVVLVLEKTSPSLDDPEVRRRAIETIVERAIQREMDERVVWHGDL
ncbi:MAG: hypothetical protein ABR529_01370 [Actinomycetota bacterium]